MERAERILIWGKVLGTFFMSFGGVKGIIYSSADTTENLLIGKSLIRFGDGEFGIYRGKSIHYQKWTPTLKQAFEKIKSDYENDPSECPYILAVPRRFMTISGWKLMEKRLYVSCWSESRYDFKKKFRHDIPYGDAFLFEKDNKEIYSKLWSSSVCPDNVIFVHNSEQYARGFADTYQKNVTFVKCPGRDAFEAVDILEKEVVKVIESNAWSTKDVMITISAGPAGKVLVYRLSKYGYWSIDAGHCWDDPLEGI